MADLFQCETKNDVLNALGLGANINQLSRINNIYYTPLSFACKRGNFEIVQILLDNGARLNCNVMQITDSEGLDAIHIAALEGFVDIVKLLLNYDPSIINKNLLLGTPLQYAIIGGNMDVLDYLLSIETININQAIGYGYTPLMTACEYKNIDAIDRLLNAGADVHIMNSLGTDLKFVTCLYGTRPIFDKLVIHGINFNENFSDTTPLIIACILNNYEIVNGLIQLGVNVNESNDDGQTPLLKAIKNGNLEIIDLLIKSGAHINELYNIKYGYNQTPLSYACSKGNIQIVQKLLDYGADLINTNLRYGPIQFASSKGHLDIIKLLISLGIDINDTNCRLKEPPLYIAVENRQREVFDYLISDINININKNGIFLETPLMAACRNGDIYMVEKLLDLKANIYPINFNGVNALYIACTYGHVAIFDMLIAHGANFHGINCCHTPLMVASENGHYEIIKRLIGLGIDIDQQNNYGKTALICAVLTNQQKVVELLLDLGANVNITDKSGYKAFDYTTCNPKIEELFRNFK